jgi:hypothetical protein
MPSNFDDPTLGSLLATAVEASRLLAAPEPAPEGVQETLDGLYARIGRRLVELALADADSRGPEEPPHADTARRTSWFEYGQPADSGPLFDPSDGLFEAIPEPDPIQVTDVGSTIDLRAPHDEEAQPAPFSEELRSLLDTLTPSCPTSDDAELAVETARLQWATSQLDEAWAAYPRSVRLALLAHLAARARHLHEHPAHAASGERTLRRLSAYRISHELPPVIALMTDQQPELGAWTADAERWWTLLSDALAND